MLLEVANLSSPHLGPLSFSLDAGELCFLLGPSGAGKSLLLRALVDLDPHEGRVSLAGRLQSDLPPNQWRRRVGLLPTESAWWAHRVGDHFPSEARPRGLAELGFGDETLGWSVKRLSSGERQRLALLRLLANRPQVLLLDEPGANLDDASAARLETLIQSYQREEGAAVLWVSHASDRPQRLGARSLHIDQGRLIP